MQSPNRLRNAQTQHGDALSVDVENIFLHRFMLSTNPTLASTTNEQDQSSKCVWYPDDTTADPTDHTDPPVSRVFNTYICSPLTICAY